MVERLVGPFMAATAAPVTIEVDLGPDRVGQVPILARRVVIHDDALPGSIRTAALAAGAGTIVAAAGLVLLLLGWWRSRGRRKRSGIPRRDVV